MIPLFNGVQKKKKVKNNNFFLRSISQKKKKKKKLSNSSYVTFWLPCVVCFKHKKEYPLNSKREDSPDLILRVQPIENVSEGAQRKKRSSLTLNIRKKWSSTRTLYDLGPFVLHFEKAQEANYHLGVVLFL